jgi:hypothetical protein
MPDAARRWWPAGERDPRQVLMLWELLRIDVFDKISMSQGKDDTSFDDIHEKISMARGKDDTVLNDISEMICMAQSKDDTMHCKEFEIDSNEKNSMAQFEDEAPVLDNISEKSCIAPDSNEKMRMAEFGDEIIMFDVSEKNCMA